MSAYISHIESWPINFAISLVYLRADGSREPVANRMAVSVVHALDWSTETSEQSKCRREWKKLQTKDHEGLHKFCLLVQTEYEKEATASICLGKLGVKIPDTLMM